jgi:integrase
MSPRYNKKITSLMDYEEFKEGIQDLDIDRQAFLSILFFAGCRISEALALDSDNVYCTRDTIFVEFFRLKGSKQTDPIPLPRTAPLVWMCEQEGALFPFHRTTGYRIVKQVWPDKYPHYFRMNRFTKTAEEYGLATMISFSGLAPTSVSHYIAKVDIKRVGKALHKEIS